MEKKVNLCFQIDLNQGVGGLHGQRQTGETLPLEPAAGLDGADDVLDDADADCSDDDDDVGDADAGIDGAGEDQEAIQEELLLQRQA